MPTLAQTTNDLLARMLRRLPASLWDTDPTSSTLQRDLYRAVAEQCALWLDQREIARQMTLLRAAAGVDLDVLLADYGLKRYLGRPDDYARQVALQILYAPQGTQYSLEQLADLLFYDRDHLTLRTGRSHTHVLVPATRPITVPYTYWGLVSEEGLWYALTVHGHVPTISQAPPPGMNLAPGPQTLHWVQVPDETGVAWYLTITGDTLRVRQSQPAGHGTAEPILVLDGDNQRWRLTVDRLAEALVTTLDAGVTAAGYWRLQTLSGTVYSLWIDGQVPTIATTPPTGVDQTPGGTPLTWITAPDTTGTLWYVWIEHDTLTVTATSPGGPGSTQPFALLDSADQLWHLSVSLPDQALVATPMRPVTDDLEVASPHHAFEAFALLDSAGVPWWLSTVNRTWQTTTTLPTGAVDRTSAGGPYRWLRATDLAGQLWYVYPETSGVVTTSLVNPGGLGTREPLSLGDNAGVQWHYGIAGSVFTVSDAPNVDYGGMATAICLKDASGTRWFWRVRAGRLEWSRWLWPDTMDQSPWGELGWLKMRTVTDEEVYVYPNLQGRPVATPGPPMTSPWGWDEPVTLRDADGMTWSPGVFPTSVGAPDYWRLRAQDGTVAYLWVDTEVLTTQASVPAGGVEQTPGTEPLDTFLVVDNLGHPLWVTLEHDTLRFDTPRPLGVSTDVGLELQDALGHLWNLDAVRGTEVVRTLLSSALWRVRVLPQMLDDIPPLPGVLPLRDAVDAFGHIQPAGGLTTVLIT